MASYSDMGKNEIASGAGYCVSVEASNAGGVAARGGEVLLRGGLVGHAAAEQLAHDAGDARGARVAARQPTRLLIVRLQQQQPHVRLRFALAAAHTLQYKQRLQIEGLQGQLCLIEK